MRHFIGALISYDRTGRPAFSECNHVSVETVEEATGAELERAARLFNESVMSGESPGARFSLTVIELPWFTVVSHNFYTPTAHGPLCDADC